MEVDDGRAGLPYRLPPRNHALSVPAHGPQQMHRHARRRLDRRMHATKHLRISTIQPCIMHDTRNRQHTCEYHGTCKGTCLLWYVCRLCPLVAQDLGCGWPMVGGSAAVMHNMFRNMSLLKRRPTHGTGGRFGPLQVHMGTFSAEQHAK